MAQALACFARPAAGRAPARMASSPPRTASCSAHTSPDQHTKSKPRAACSMPLAASGTRRPSALPCRCAAAPMRSTASANLGCVNSPGMPSDDDRSKCPIHRPSTPSTAAMASTCSTPEAVSMSANRQVRSFAAASRSCTGPAPLKLSWAMPSATPRAPSGVYLRWETSSGADVGRARDVVVALRGHAHDRRQLRRLAVAYRALHRFEGEAGMLHVDEGEVAARALEDVADPRRRELDEEMTELELARPTKPLQGVRHPRRPPGRSGGGRHSP